MSGDDRSVANPERTQIDDEEQVTEQVNEQTTEQQPTGDQPEGEPPVHRTERRHEQPWPAVAREVEQAEDALG